MSWPLLDAMLWASPLEWAALLGSAAALVLVTRPCR